MNKTEYISHLAAKGYDVHGQDQVSLGALLFDIRETTVHTAMGDQKSFCLKLSPKSDMKNIPLYKYPATHAEENGELEQYRASYKANVACKEAIEESIHNHYAQYTLDTEASVEEVVQMFGFERVLYVLANTVQHKMWDGRISSSNKEWAKTVTIFPDGGYGGNRLCRFVVDRCNPGLTDMFLTCARKAYSKQL